MGNIAREGVKKIGLCPKCDKQPKKQNWEKLLILMIAVNLMIVVNLQIVNKSADFDDTDDSGAKKLS